MTTGTAEKEKVREAEQKMFGKSDCPEPYCTVPLALERDSSLSLRLPHPGRGGRRRLLLTVCVLQLPGNNPEAGEDRASGTGRDWLELGWPQSVPTGGQWGKPSPVFHITLSEGRGTEL